ncbi:MAG: helix-turn-helix domain-containing protein [Hyphomonadaceae bacterium]
MEQLDERSRPANWFIRPHAHRDLHHVFHITAGGGVAEADGKRLSFVAPCIIVVPAGVVHGFNWQADSIGTVLTFADAFLRAIVSRHPQASAPFAQGLWCAPTDGAFIEDALAGVRRELGWNAAGGDLAIESHLSTVLVETLRLHVHSEHEARAPAGPYALLVTRYRELLERRYREQPSIEDCARELGVAPGQLRRACQSVAGAAPAKLMQQRLIVEAQRVMRYSNMTVAQVGLYLGFEDPAYFTRFFTNMTRTSPRAYRKQAQAAS